jgi:hypothetical protein
LAKLAQAYIHLRPYSITGERLRRLGEATDRLAYEAADRVYGGGVSVDVELEEGSLKVRVTVIGSLVLSLYANVANYKGFKDSVADMCNEAREYTVDVCGAFKERAGAADTQVYRMERRLKTPGKLYRLLRKLEKLEGSVTELSPKEMRSRLRDAHEELEAILSDLSDEEGAVVVKAVNFKKLPPVKEWPRRGDEDKMPRVATKRQSEEFDFFRDSRAVPEEEASNLRAEGGRPRLSYHNRFPVAKSKRGIGRRPGAELLD